MSPADVHAAHDVQFDPFNEALIVSPGTAFEQLRAEVPIHWSPIVNAWILTRLEDVSAVLTDRRLDTSDNSLLVAEIARRSTRDYSDLLGFMRAMPFFKNGEDHRRSRRILSQVVNRIPLSKVEVAARRIAKDLAEPLRSRETYDVVADFGDPMPQRVMAHILDIPNEDVMGLGELLYDLTLALDPATVQTYDRLNGRVALALETLRARIDAAREDQDSGLGVIYWASAGEGSEKLANAALTVLFTLRVGAETTMGFIGFLARALIEQPQLREAVQADPGRAELIVSEVMRLESSVQRAVRIAREPVTIGDKTVQKGQRVIVMLGAANRDPDAFHSAGEVALCPHNADDVTFGRGPHFCPGASLAQLEGRIALETLFVSLPAVELAGEPQWYGGRAIRRLITLPVRKAKSAT